MKLNYAALLSPFPLPIEQVGSIKCPTLREIFAPDTTYQGYHTYLSFLLMDPQLYYDQVNPSKAHWFQSFPEEQRLRLSMFDLIVREQELQSLYAKLFNFFFIEDVVWDHDRQVFLTFQQEAAAGHPHLPAGVIHREIFLELCDIILQRCGVSVSDTTADISKTKNKRALEIVRKLRQGKERLKSGSRAGHDIKLPAIISAVAVRSNSINFINIWDLTVYQLYEQFKREQANIYFNIQQMSVAAYGNKENTFKGNEWYQL